MLFSQQEVRVASGGRTKRKAYLADTGERRNYIGYSNLESQFPVRILGGRPVELVVGDDIAAAEKAGSLKELRLEIGVANIEPEELVAIQVNGISVPPNRIARGGETQFTVKLSAPSMRRGINRVSFAPGKNSPGHLDSQVTGLRLVVHYK